jgi:hypothetical protein
MPDLPGAIRSCLYFHGPTAEVLDIPSSEPRSDLPAMTSGDLRGQLGKALRRAQIEDAKIVVPGVRSSRGGVEESRLEWLRPALQAGERHGVGHLHQCSRVRLWRILKKLPTPSRQGVLNRNYEHEL